MYLNPPCRIDIGYEKKDNTILVKPNKNGEVRIKGLDGGAYGRTQSKVLIRWLNELGVSKGTYYGEWDKKKNMLKFYL